MDIRKWLAEIENPVLSEQPGVERFPLPRQPDPVPDAGRRRKRSSSDSSLLKAPSPRPRPKGIPAIKRDSHNARNLVESARSDASDSAASESTDDSTVSQRYARKPRRKARPGKYNARSERPKEQEDQHPNRKSGSKKSKRKPKRRKGEKTHNGIGQEFQAKNVSKDRLTLKPLEKNGLFSKGRTSTSVQGRGLPDLVFSGMKFLRNDHGGKDRTAQASDARKKRKDHARTKEEDISAFFTSVRPALADTNGNTMAKHEHLLVKTSIGTKADRPRRAREPSNVPDAAIPTLESEDKASYLGFGSRGPLHESTSCFSWSESVRAPSVTLVRPKSTSTVHRKRLDLSNREISEVPYGGHTAVRQKTLSSIRRVPTTITVDRARVSSVAPMPSGFSRSHSLPQRSSSPRRPNLVDRAVTSPLSMPPTLRTRVNAEHQDISMAESPIRTSHASGDAISAQGRVSTDIARRLVLHESPQQSFSLGDILQHCNNMSQAEHRRAPSRRNCRVEAHFPSGRPDTNRQARRVSYQRTAQAPTVRFVAPDAQPSRVPNFSGASFYVQQEHRQHLPVRFDFEEHGERQHPDIVVQEYMDESDLLDQGHLEPVSYGMMEDPDGELKGLGYVVEGVEQMPEPEHTTVVGAGFWRPNKLY